MINKLSKLLTSVYQNPNMMTANSGYSRINIYDLNSSSIKGTLLSLSKELDPLLLDHKICDDFQCKDVSIVPRFPYVDVFT